MVHCDRRHSSSTLSDLNREREIIRDFELIQTQYFCHHADTICHPNSSYVTIELYETSACGCNNNTIFQNELFFAFPTVDVLCSLAAQKPW